MSTEVTPIAADRFKMSAVIFACKLLVLICLLFSFPAAAHFQLNINIRIFHIEPLSDGIRLSIRFPAALAFSEFSGSTENTIIPYLISRPEGDKIEHILDQRNIETDLTEFKQFLVNGYGLVIDGKKLQAEDIRVRIFEASRQTRFTSLAEVNASFSEMEPFQYSTEVSLSDAVIDIQAMFPTTNLQGEIRLYNKLNSNLPEDTFIANLVIFYSDEGQGVTRITGFLEQPVIVNPLASNAIKSYVIQGFKHISSGLDHILFILCLTIAATGLKRLLWAVNGFTLGHTLTLIAGFYGYVPTGSWFIPLVEILIAASIILIAILTLRNTTHSLNIWLTSAIGLLHGFGFSFLLSELLGPDSPHLILSLLSFNLGIELGQLFIVTIMFLALLALAYARPTSRTIAGNFVLLGSMGISLWWVVERSLMLASIV